jgi:hypothetical protein
MIETEQLVKRREETRDMYRKRYKEIVRDFINGVEPIDTDEVLAALGKSVEAFAADIARMKERDKLAELRREGREARERLQQLNAEIDEADRKFMEEVQEAHRKKMQEMRHSARCLWSESDTGYQAECELRACCDPKLIKAERDWEEHLDKLRKELHRFSERLKKEQAVPAKGTMRIAAYGGCPSPGADVGVINRCIETCESLRKEIEETKTKIAEIRAEQLIP